jgi:hypothetical protein
VVWRKVFVHQGFGSTDSLLRVENEHALKEINS